MTPRLPRSPNPGAAGERVDLARRRAITAPALAGLDPYLGLRQLARYSGLSERTLRAHLRGRNQIPHFRVGGRVLVKVSEFDAWMAAFRCASAAAAGQVEEIASVVDDLLASLTPDARAPHNRRHGGG